MFFWSLPDIIGFFLSINLFICFVRGKKLVSIYKTDDSGFKCSFSVRHVYFVAKFFFMDVLRDEKKRFIFFGMLQMEAGDFFNLKLKI